MCVVLSLSQQILDESTICYQCQKTVAFTRPALIYRSFDSVVYQFHRTVFCSADCFVLYHVKQPANVYLLV